MATLAIFLCGYGIGHLVGESAKTNPSLPDGQTDHHTDDWSQTTFSRLDTLLALTPEQKVMVKREVQKTSVQERKLLIKLYSSISPYLDQAQQDQLENRKQKLNSEGGL